MDSYVGTLPDGSDRLGRGLAANVGVRDAAQAPAPVLRAGQLMRLLRRHAWLIGLCAVVAAGAAFAYARTLPKTYTANSTLTVEGDRFAIPQLQGALRSESAPDPMPWVRTEVQALGSRAMLQAVIAKLHLEANPEFNPTLEAPGLLQAIKARLSAVVAALMPKGPDGGADVSPDELVLGNVGRALAVFQDNRSLVISISFTARDPSVAAAFVNTLMDQYVQSRTKRRDDVNEGANTVMTQRVEQVRGDLARIEQEMRDLRNKDGMVTLRAGGVGQQQLEELTTAAARATTERSQLQVSYDRAAAAARAGSSDALAAVLNSPTVAALREREAQASQRMAQLSAHYGADYPGMRSAAAELSSARRQIGEEAGRIVASLGAQLRVARDQEASVQQQLAQARQNGVVADNARAQLEQLQQEATTRRALYQTLLVQAQQTAAQPASIAAPDVRVLSPAVAPGLPSGPNAKLAALMGGSGGALLGCLIALTRLRSVTALDTAQTLAAATGLPVLATLPRRLLERDRGVLAAASRCDGADAQAMRGLRARLRFAGRREAPRAVLFAPATAGEAAEAAAACLAAAFARVAASDGERVLLLEGDMQAPRLGRLLGRLPGRRTGGDGAGGELERVFDGADWRDAVVPDRQPDLDMLLPAGRKADAAALLGGVTFLNLLVEARGDYDLVVIHAPATPAEAGALIQRADSAILVVDSRADPAATRAAATRLGASSTPLAALLLARS